MTREDLRSYAEAGFRLLYPAYCGICHAFLSLEEKYLCKPCEARLSTTRFSQDESCLDIAVDYLDEAWAVFPYESPVKDLISAVKFSRKRWLLHAFRPDLEKMVSVLASENHYDAIVPIPMDRKRLFQREFNPSELLARMIRPHFNSRLNPALLKKRFFTTPQSTLNRRERQINLFGSFRTPAKNLKGQSILLIDDIVTTGATADEAARILKKQGAKRVDLLALAHTPEPA